MKEKACLREEQGKEGPRKEARERGRREREEGGRQEGTETDGLLNASAERFTRHLPQRSSEAPQFKSLQLHHLDGDGYDDHNDYIASLL